MLAKRWPLAVLGLALLGGTLGLTSCGESEQPGETIAVVQSAATVPSGFVDERIASSMPSPTAMAFAPDGRVFVAQQGGQLRVIKNGSLLSTPFLTVTTTATGERGLLGVAFDPNFSSNRFVYVYYTATSPAVHNRLSRFTANGDVAQSGSETILLELNNLSSATNHNGGALHFGPDGKLYVAVGENANGSHAQSLNNLLGKMLRINADGSIPSDNPFFTQASGVNRAIWALGLRNPFTFAFQPGTGRMFINDVGQGSWEEINDGIRGSNYGWPATEGATSEARFRSPLLSYGHGSGSTTGCAITGGTFYNPSTPQFPSSYVGKYFFADYCSDWIRVFDPSTGTASGFASALASPVDLRVGPDGALYYLQRGNGGELRRVRSATSQAPAITTQPASQTVSVGQQVTFGVAASGSQPLSYQWQRGTTNIGAATGSSYTFTPTLADNGATFRVVVSNAFGTATSNSATLRVTSNSPPTASISAPSSGATYRAGDTVSYTGNASDPEDGTLPASAFTWEVVFHHDTHTHPFVAPTTGSRSGTFTIPNRGETATNVWYRVRLTVRDSAGLTHTTFTDIRPQTSTLTLQTNPPGLQVTVDGAPVTTPASISSVVGLVRSIGAVSPQTSGTAQYAFSSWSDAGTQTHDITTPATNATYTATYSQSSGGLTAEYFDNSDFSALKVTRTDATLNFDWGSGAPASGVGADTFAVRWTGTITPERSEPYTFYTHSDDGIRVWINDVLVIDNWTDHGVVENSGTTAVLTAGQAYPIRVDYYENGGLSVAKLLWSSASTAKQIVPQSRLSPVAPLAFPIKINFQLSSASVPAGYLVDSGAVFGNRANLVYGWSTSHSDVCRDRNANGNQLLDTLCHFHANGLWEIALPSGRYNVKAGIGDASVASTHTVIVEGVTYWSNRSLGLNQFLDATQSILVTDGRLTLSQGNASEKSTRINFVEITRQ